MKYIIYFRWRRTFKIGGGGGCHGGGCCGGGCSDNNDTGVADNDDSTKDNVYNKGEIQDP